MNKYVNGNIVKGIVTGITSYGIFVGFDDYYSGLIHISEISHNFVKDVHDYVNIGDTIYVKIIGVDEDEGHLKLSIKDVKYKQKIFSKKLKIIETKTGFRTLEYKLPIWVKESLKKIEKK